MIGCKALSQNEIECILGNLDKLRDKTLFLFNLYTGFRIKESLSLKVSDILLNNEITNRITVQRKSMKGKISSRTILLHPNLRMHLKALVKEQGLISTDYLFKSRNGDNRPITRNQAWFNFNKAVKKANLEGKIGLHSTRKTFADRMYTAFDKDLLKTSKALGHKNIGSTISYLSFRTEELDEAITNMELESIKVKLAR